MIVGPYFKWKDALGFFNLWSRQTRGKARRLQRGVSLLINYREQYNLWMWVQSESIETLRARVETERAAFPVQGGNKRTRIKQLLEHGDGPRNGGTVSIQTVRLQKRLRSE